MSFVITQILGILGGGHPITSQELLDQALQYRAFWGRKGGVTVSGGEPLLAN